MRYVALLRGVNVGGNHRVPNNEFRKVLEKLGFSDVLVYINSGNAIFTAERIVNSGEVQVALEKHFGFTIPTLVLPGSKIQAIASAIPGDWSNDSPSPDKTGHKSDVLYLFDELNVPTILTTLSYNPKIEQMMYVDGAVLATISRKNQSKGSLQKLKGTKLYAQVTIRNITTAKKLAELVG